MWCIACVMALSWPGEQRPRCPFCCCSCGPKRLVLRVPPTQRVHVGHTRPSSVTFSPLHLYNSFMVFPPLAFLYIPLYKTRTQGSVKDVAKAISKPSVLQIFSCLLWFDIAKLLSIATKLPGKGEVKCYVGILFLQWVVSVL